MDDDASFPMILDSFQSVVWYPVQWALVIPDLSLV